MRGVQPNFKTPLWRVLGMRLARSIGLDFDGLNQARVIVHWSAVDGNLLECARLDLGPVAHWADHSNARDGCGGDGALGLN